jgi:hypothetical protein
MFTINGERLTFALTNDQDKQFSISAATEDEKHWELQPIDENSAKLFTNGEYPLATLKTIVENILIQQIIDPDVTVNISQVKEDLLVIMTMKEKWVERKITLQFDSKKRATEIERLETLLTKTRRECAQMKDSHEEQILQLTKEMHDLRQMINKSKCLTVQHASPLDLRKLTNDKVCSIVLPKGVWLVTYTFIHQGSKEVPAVLMYDSVCISGQPGGTGMVDGFDGLTNWRYAGTTIVHSTGEGQVYLKFSPVLYNGYLLPTVWDIILYAQPTAVIQAQPTSISNKDIATMKIQPPNMPIEVDFRPVFTFSM